MYPQSPEEWKKWISERMGIESEEGTKLAERGEFPFDLLVRVWEKEFNVENGYHPDFIPALTRNKRGLVIWIFCGGSEPNWTLSDEA